jgi:hypothetical protein
LSTGCGKVETAKHGLRSYDFIRFNSLNNLMQPVQSNPAEQQCKPAETERKVK